MLQSLKSTKICCSSFKMNAACEHVYSLVFSFLLIYVTGSQTAGVIVHYLHVCSDKNSLVFCFSKVYLEYLSYC